MSQEFYIITQKWLDAHWGDEFELQQIVRASKYESTIPNFNMWDLRSLDENVKTTKYGIHTLVPLIGSCWMYQGGGGPLGCSRYIFKPVATFNKYSIDFVQGTWYGEDQRRESTVFVPPNLSRNWKLLRI